MARPVRGLSVVEDVFGVFAIRIAGGADVHLAIPAVVEQVVRNFELAVVKILAATPDVESLQISVALEVEPVKFR